jgi:hypothetical protein
LLAIGWHEMKTETGATMIDPQEARDRLHELIDDMPDDQVTLVWTTFQNMFNGEFDDYDEEGEDENAELE